MRAAEACARLAACETPFLIGVRHHSPACAAAIPALLDGFGPDRLYVELPADFAPWIEWLGHPDAQAPLALAAAGEGVSFYPFADFSPELVAVRWARARGVPVEPFDLPVGARVGGARARGGARVEGGAPARGASLDLPDWDTLVEAPAVTSGAEATRRAALVYGWALRVAHGASPEDLAREAHMRARLAASPGARAAVVTGAFHDAALVPDSVVLAEPGLDPIPRVDHVPPTVATPKTSLLPYRADLLDARSGYPAGVLDPGWHSRVFRALVDGGPLVGVAAEVVVAVCREMRRARHVAGPPDAAEALRLAMELARLRGLGAPGRGEVLEALQCALAQGELLGRGRVLAGALERVLVGPARGRLAPGTPRSGLLPAVEALIAELRLPGPDEAEEKLLRLDPLRSDLDRRRHVALHRLAALHVPYATLADVEPDTLTHAWGVRWEPATEASLELAAAWGCELEQATAGALAAERPRDDGEDAPPAVDTLAWLTTVAECGLVGLARAGIAALPDLRAGLPVLVDAVAFVDRVARGHVPGLPAAEVVAPGDRVARGHVPGLPAGEGVEPGDARGHLPGLPAVEVVEPGAAREACYAAAVRDALYAAAVRSLDGLAGSADPADARALGALVRLATGEGRTDDGRLGHAVDALARDGAARIAGAAGVARLRLGRVASGELGADLAARIEAAESDESRRDLGDRLGGAVEAAGALLEAHPPLLAAIAGPVEGLPDAAFLARLPALRHGFDPLSAAARRRLLAVLAERLGEDTPDAGALDAELAAVDAAGRAAVVALGLWPATVPDLGSPTLVRRVPTAHAFGPLVRWRLVLGQDEGLQGSAARYAGSLSELYGHGGGEGSRGEGGGRGAAFPTAREWADELGDLFGEAVRVEVVGRAAERGDGAALLLLDADAVTPSIALLEQALSLAGGLGEADLAPLRRLCERVTRALLDALAVRVRPALAGLGSPRATRRRTDRLHLARTIEANLATVRRDGERVHIVPERLRFRSRSRREMDWHVVLVVDTSGSMEASVIHAAMMAAILAGLPAVSVSFYAFADEVIDFSDRVDDPLGLLLGVSIGGGTRIHRALRYARERVRVPQRTLLVLVTDFEEGGSPSALVDEVRALAESGVRLLGVAALDEAAKPRFSEPMAARVVAAGMPVAALSPMELARWVGERIRGSA